MKWTKQLTIEFIQAYRRKEILWNSKHSLYFHKDKKQVVWLELSQELNIPVEQLKRKMEILLAGVRRERMKMRKTIAAGKGANRTYQSAWFAYEALQFLMDKNKRRQITNTVRSKIKTERIEGDREEDPSSVQEIETSPLPLPSPKEQKKTDDQSSGRTIETLTSCSNQNTNDECQHFGNMIAAKLRNFDQHTQWAIQKDIMSVFLKASRGFYSHFYSTPVQPHGQCPHYQRNASQSNTVTPHASLSFYDSLNPASDCSESLSE